jgi:ribosomal protein L19
VKGEAVVVTVASDQSKTAAAAVRHFLESSIWVMGTIHPFTVEHEFILHVPHINSIVCGTPKYSRPQQ